MKQIKLYTTAEVNQDFEHTSKWVKADDYDELFKQFWDAQEKLMLAGLNEGMIVFVHKE